MEVRFTWDQAAHRLRREPESPACTREENMKFAAATTAIRGEDPVARETAKYELAKLAYEQRDWYQPCRTIPGGAMPRFMDSNEPGNFHMVRTGVHILKGASTAREAALLIEKKPEAEQASRFLDYVLRVSTVEAYNESCCLALLMSHAWLSELNPEGDAPAIELLRELLRGWYRIAEPGEDRAAQAKHHARDFRWLTSGWRTLWESP